MPDEQPVTATGAGGRVAVSPQAVATVARAAVSECYGVVALATTRRRVGLLRRARGVEPFPGVVVAVEGEAITITLHVVVEYGVRISEVARNIRETVGFAVEQALGMPVAAVNVHVDGLHITRE